MKRHHNMNILSFFKNPYVLITCMATSFFLLQCNTDQPSDIDHATVIRELNSSTFQKGEAIYKSACVACHGERGTSSLPQARSFSRDTLRFGNRPFDMWKTITYGAGMMPAQSWMSPQERYYVIQYIREQFIKDSNAHQYFNITDEYLATLPKSKRSREDYLKTIKADALKGSLQYGQDWFGSTKSDYGSAIYSQLKDHTTAALTVLLDEHVTISYNLLRMGLTAAWEGELNTGDTKYKRYRGEGEPFVEGNVLNGLDTWQWAFGGRLEELNKTTGVRSPLPSDVMRFHGHYKNGNQVILSYSVSGRKIYELPAATKHNNSILLTQTLQIGPGQEQQIYIGQLLDEKGTFKNGTLSVDGKWGTPVSSDQAYVLVSSTSAGNVTNKFLAAGVFSNGFGVTGYVDDQNRMALTIPASTTDMLVHVLRTSGEGEQQLENFISRFKKQVSATAFPNIPALIKGGSRLWNYTVPAKGELDAGKPHADPVYYKDQDKTDAGKLVEIRDDYPYAVDNIGLPFNNEDNSWIRPTALAFMDDGRLLLTTYGGDVWMATGIDNSLKNINWQRIAAGLYEPMGLRVIKDKIYVTCRNGIIILHDLNGDNETDFYENFFPDTDVSSFFHAFNFGLETDSEGNLYYVKPGAYTNNKMPGNVLKISPDGKKWENLATGFRVNNGITVTPGNDIFVSDNQGQWTPANKINHIKKGKFYGYVPNLASKEWSPDGIQFGEDQVVDGVVNADIIAVPGSFEPPALWIPQEFDNSPGGGVWSDKTWGPLGNQFIHTSYGKGWIYHFHPHEANGVTQGSMIALPFQFDAGIQRAAVNPADKQIYVTGLTGWDDGVASKYGTLNRIRYKGGEGHLIKDAEVLKNGVRLQFNFELDKEKCELVENYKVSQWNYKWTSNYGSSHYSIKHKGEKGEDTVIVKNVFLSEDRQSVFLEIPDIQPVHTMRIRFEAYGRDGVKIKDVVYLTINTIPQKGI